MVSEDAARVSVRPAVAADASLLAELRATAQAERSADIAPAALAAFAATCAAYFARSLASDDGFLRAWIAEVDEQPAGAAILTVVPTLPRFGGVVRSSDGQPRDARVRNVYVDPAHRRRGVGAALMRAIIDASREAGIDRLGLGATEAGRRLYETLGFELKGDEMVYREPE